MGQNLILVINAIWPLEYLEIFFFNPSASNMFFFVCYSIDTDLTFKTKDQCICSVSHYCSSDSGKVKKSGRGITKTALQKHNNNKNQTNKQEKKKKKGGGQQTKLGFVLQFPEWVVPLQLAIRRRLLFPCLIWILVLHLNHLPWNVGLWFSNITEYFQRGKIVSENKIVLV